MECRFRGTAADPMSAGDAPMAGTSLSSRYAAESSSGHLMANFARLAIGKIRVVNAGGDRGGGAGCGSAQQSTVIGSSALLRVTTRPIRAVCR